MSEAIKTEMIGHLPRLRAFARALTGAPDRADDLVQQTIEKALRGIAGYAPDTRLDSWLFRIMRNFHIDNLRARRPTTPLEDAELTAPLVGEDRRRVTEGRLHLAEVQRAMARLPEEQRVVLMLVCVEGLRYREVAETLGVPEGTVMSRLSRARLALAEVLGMETQTKSHGKGQQA